MVGLLSLALCGVLALTAYTDDVAVAAAVVLAQLVLASGVSAGQVVPGPRLAAVVVALGGVLATGLTLWPTAVGAADRTATLAGLAPAAGAVMLAALFAQMARRGGRPALTSALAMTVTLGVLALLLASWVAANRLPAAPALIAVAVVAVGVTGAGMSIRGPRPAVDCAAVLMAAAGATAVCLLVDDAPAWPFGAAFGLSAGLLTVAGRRLGSAWAASPAQRLPLEAVTPLALVGPVLVVAGRLFVP